MLYNASIDIFFDVKIDMDMKQAILDLVRDYGFISVWMYVFEDEPEILRQLVKCFSGTKEEYFDANGRVKEVIK